MIAATPASSKRRARSSADHLARLRPAFDGDLAVARVDADGDAAGEVARGLAHEIRIAHRGRAEDHPVDALLQPHGDGVEIADTAAELNGKMRGGEDRLDRFLIDGLAFERAIEIDHVQPLEALRLECFRLRRRIGVEHRRLVHFALDEAHALSVFQIDRGKQDHAVKISLRLPFEKIGDQREP